MARPWREVDHPRDPANGEFVDKQGWAGRVVTAMFGARRVQGRDIDEAEMDRRVQSGWKHRDGRVMYYVILNRTAVAAQEAE